jgi:putative ABC transport system substrate-binding protein
MKRRLFITLLGGAAAAWALTARVQQRASVPVVGFLFPGNLSRSERLVAAFRKGLREMGYVEGDNIAIEFRSGNGQSDQVPAMAAELVRRQVDVIFVNSSPGTLAARSATATIPIVFQLAQDPVQLGLAASLNRPGGNLTGATSLNVELGPKRLEILHELVPAASSAALLVNRTSPNAEVVARDTEAAARALGLRLHVVSASTEREIEAAFESVRRTQPGGLVISPDSLFLSQCDELARLAASQSLPAVHAYPEFAESGGLMSYAGSLADGFYRAGIYTGRILKGERPAELPIQQSTKIELVINMKTAKALGITVPPSLLARADGVIE